MRTDCVQTATEGQQFSEAPTIESKIRYCVQSLHKAQGCLDHLEKQLRGSDPVDMASTEPESSDVMSRSEQAHRLAQEIHRRINDLTAVVGGDT